MKLNQCTLETEHYTSNLEPKEYPKCKFKHGIGDGISACSALEDSMPCKYRKIVMLSEDNNGDTKM